MFALVGRAITQWSFVEERLCSIFTVCTSIVAARPNSGIEYLDSQVPMEIFYSIENFRSKLGLVDAALTSRISMSSPRADDVLVEWGRLKDKTRKLSLKRNKLAHWMVLPAFDYEHLHPARLVPPYGSPGFYRATGLSPEKYTLKPEHIRHLELAFYLLSEKLRGFVQSLARREELFERYVQLQERLLHSLDRTDPTRAERLRRALSSVE